MPPLHLNHCHCSLSQYPFQWFELIVSQHYLTETIKQISKTIGKKGEKEKKKKTTNLVTFQSLVYVFFNSTRKSNKTKMKKCERQILTGNMLLFMVHVKLTGGKDGPETQVAFNNSPIAMPFLLLFGILYTDSTGLRAGNSATSIFDVLASV